MIISVPDGSPEELIATAQSVEGYVTTAGGTVLRISSDSPWGRRRLAYPIRHNSADLRDGFYTLYHFQIQPQGLEDIEREIRLNERIIRHLLLQLDSEPIFVEVEEEETEIVDPETGEVAIIDETVIVAEDAATGEVVAIDEVAEVIENVETGEVEIVDETVEIDENPAAGEVEIIDEVEDALVDAEGNVEAVAEKTEVIDAEEE